MKDLFTEYTFNPPGSHRRKKKRPKLNNNDIHTEGSSLSSEAKLDKCPDGSAAVTDQDPTSSEIAKAAFGASSEMGGNCLTRKRHGDDDQDQVDSNSNITRQGQNIQDEDEEDSEAANLLPTSLETDLNLNHFIECLDIFGGAPALRNPGNRFESSSANHNNKNEEDDLITEEFRRRARERRERERERNGNEEESSERRHYQSGAAGGSRTSKEDKDKTAMRMSWKGHGHPFVLLLEEQNVVTRCELSTIETYEIRDLGFSSTEDVAKAIINSEWLQSAFSSVDPSASSLSILFSPSYRPASILSAFTTSTSLPYQNRGNNNDETIDDTTVHGNPVDDESWMQDRNDNADKSRREREKEKSKGKRKESAKKNKPVQMLRLSADGDFGSSVIELPVDPAVVFEFNCRYETENKYNFNHLSHLLKALSASTKVAIRVNEVGCAVFQFLMPKGTAGSIRDRQGGGAADTGGYGSSCGFVDFYILPLEQIELQDEQESQGEGTSSD